MIPQRMPDSEISDSGLKDRVTACRKRLRANRVTHKRPALNQADELATVIGPAVSEFQGGELEASGKLLFAEEPEVGIA